MPAQPWTAYYVAAALPVLTAAVWVRFARQRMPVLVDREVGWMVWHWFTGGKLEQQRNQPTPDIDRRILVGYARTSAVAALVAAEYLRSGSPLGTGLEVVFAVGYGGAVAAGLWVAAVAEVAAWSAHHRWWVRPFWLAIQKDTGWKPDTPTDGPVSATKQAEKVPPPRRMIRFPRLGVHGKGRGNRAREGVLGALHRRGWHRTARTVARWWHPRPAGVVATLAPTFQFWDVKKRHVSDDATAKLGRRVRYTWLTEGRWRHVQFLPAAVLPPAVMWNDADVRLLMELPETADAPLLGCGHNNAPVRLSWVQSPHVAMSAGTGGGKSTEIAFIAAQVLYHGGIVTILDVRQNSHPWARDLAGVRYCRKIGDIYQAAVDLDAEVTRRGEIAGDLEVGDDADWQRHLVVVEELNTTRPRLNNYYRTHLGGSPNKAAPAIDALTSGIFMGRDLRINYLIAAQRFQDKLLSGPAKDMFFGRLLARYEPLAWKDLAKGDYVPADDHPGRAMLCYGANEYPIQMGLIEHADIPATHGNIRRWLSSPGSRWVGLPDALPVGRRLELRSVKALGSGEQPAQRNSQAGPHHKPPRGVIGERHPDTDDGHDRESHRYGLPAHPVEDPYRGETGNSKGCGGELDDLEHDGRLSSPTTLPPVDTTVNRHGGQGEAGKPEETGVMVSDPQPHSLDRSVHPKTTQRTRPGFSGAEGEGSSTQEMWRDPGITGNDGGIEYVTVRDACLEHRGIVPMRYDALRKAADRPGFPDAVNPEEEHKYLRRYADRELVEWFENRDVGDPGVYVIEPPYDLKVKIGETKRLKARIDEFSWSALPQSELVRHWFPCESKDHAKDLEDWFRVKYGEQRIGKTEWHKKEGLLAADLGSDARMLDGCPTEIRPREEVRS
jgi:hypothetical protein